MNNLQKDLELAQTLSGNSLDEFLMQIKEKYTSSEDKKVITEFMMKRADELFNQMGEVEKKLDELSVREQLNNDLEILPLSYIAKHYFNKSSSWLYQRLNGNPVRGKVYKFKPEEIKILNDALQDIAKRIGALSIS